jgi:hypothetical protein
MTGIIGELAERRFTAQKSTGYPSRPLRNNRDSLTMTPNQLKKGKHHGQKKFNIYGLEKTTDKIE